MGVDSILSRPHHKRAEVELVPPDETSSPKARETGEELSMNIKGLHQVESSSQNTHGSIWCGTS
jgi:hypothetical protein